MSSIVWLGFAIAEIEIELKSDLLRLLASTGGIPHKRAHYEVKSQRVMMSILFFSFAPGMQTDPLSRQRIVFPGPKFRTVARRHD